MGVTLEELAADPPSFPASLPPSRTAASVPVVNLVLGLEDAKRAARYMRRQQAVGKIAVHMP